MEVVFTRVRNMHRTRLTLTLSVLQTRGNYTLITPEYARAKISPKPETLLRMFAEGRNVSALSVDSKWGECHAASHLLSYHHLHRPSDDMKLLRFLCLPKSHRRARSKARSEIGPTEDQSGADPVVRIPRPTESAPDLRIGISTLPTPSPLTSRDQESNSM